MEQVIDASKLASLTVVKKNPGDVVVAFAGNPNVGKSTLFNSLTGLRQHTGNWPGKTVGIAQGNREFQNKNYVLVDLPGTYSLMAHSAEEEVARDFILSQDAEGVVVVCDATSLERNLNLVLQIMLLTKKVVVCVNLLDEAKRKQITIDLKKLAFLLGVPVVGTSATYEEGIDELMAAVKGITEGTLATNPTMFQQLKAMVHDNEEEKVAALIDRAAVIAADVTTYSKTEYDKTDRKLDKLFTSKLTGIPIMILMLLLVFWFTIEGANAPSDMLANLLFGFQDKLMAWTTAGHWPAWLQGLLIEGVYKVVAWVIAVMLPPMAIFFPIFTLLEDFGYLPRVAFNMDHAFQKAGACGKQALSMCMGFGCNAAGVTGTRIIDSPRERLIAIITNNFVPCNGRFPILITVITLFFVGSGVGFGNSIFSAIFLTAAILLGVFMTMIISRVLSKTVLSGIPSSFTLELPPYRKPRVGQVLVRSILDRTIFVLGRAITVSAPVGVVIWLFANINIGDVSLLHHITTFLDPFAHLMGLDGVILMAFILGFPANEIVIPCMLMGYLATNTIVDYDSLAQLKTLLVDNGWTWLTALNVILFTLFHWPCGTTMLTIKKESGSAKWTFASFIIPTAIGVVMTMCTTLIAHLFHLV
ncbi:ferrous iron transport protein B [Enterococcus nangangensis]|uniref:ferrous iron transport protein B n=1 Tax=Enterococcus nangangensis TaxID=2559926 RepID=UPI0010F5AA37|nr:ferrous iron transport protein B [Enterococcus nangangensis]